MAEMEMTGKVHPACVNAENPYHECVEHCFRVIAEKREALAQSGAASDSVVPSEEPLPSVLGRGSKRKAEDAERPSEEASEASEPAARADELGSGEAKDVVEGDGKDSEAYANMSERQKKLFDLRLKLNAARKANQGAIAAERKREEAPKESRGISKQKWFEEKKERLGKQLRSNGLEMSQAYMLETQESAEVKYKKWDKKPAAFGWDVFNQRSLYTAYKKRTKNIPNTLEDYMKARDGDPDFYRDGASLQYGKTPDIPEQNVDRMVDELMQRDQSRKDFSRRRKFHEEKDIDSINDRNEHFNRKIERAFGKYTVEIKNNLERGTALPD